MLYTLHLHSYVKYISINLKMNLNFINKGSAG